jgi:hypothetical protein
MRTRGRTSEPTQRSAQRLQPRRVPLVRFVLELRRNLLAHRRGEGLEGVLAGSGVDVVEQAADDRGRLDDLGVDGVGVADRRRVDVHLVGVEATGENVGVDVARQNGLRASAAHLLLVESPVVLRVEPGVLRVLVRPRGALRVRTALALGLVGHLVGRLLDTGEVLGEPRAEAQRDHRVSGEQWLTLDDVNAADARHRGEPELGAGENLDRDVGDLALEGFGQERGLRQRLGEGVHLVE